MLPPYNDWVKTLAADCDTSGFALPPRLLDIAYRQIVVEGEVAFGINTDTAAIRNKIINGLRRSDDMTALGAGLYLYTQKQPLQWPLYDRCLRICKEYDLYPDAYCYLLEAPHKPVSVAEAVPTLKVAVMKELLLAHGITPVGKRADIEKQVSAGLTLEQLGSAVMPHLASERAHFTARCHKEAYAALLRMILHRAYFLRRLAKWPQKVFPCVELGRITAEEAAFAQHIVDGGYDSVLDGSNIKRLLPLYPGDMVEIYFRVRGTAANL